MPTSTITPPDLVAGAPRTALPYGMFSVLPWRDEAGAHWQGGGVVWEYLDPFTVDSIGPVQNPQSDTFGLPKNLGAPTDESGGEPDPGFTQALMFYAYSHFRVTPVAWTPAQAKQRAIDTLLAFEERQTEQQFWRGTSGATPNMSNPENVGSYGESEIWVGLGALETYIGDAYGSLGVVHMARQHALSLLHNGTLVVQGGRLFTALGTPVIAGSGYPVGTLRATPALFGYRSEIFEPSMVPGDLLDRSNNDLYAVAERAYLIGFDPTGVGEVTITS